MPRTPRILLSKSYYHIITRGNNRNIVFKSDNDYHYYLQLLDKYKSDLPFDLFHYCLMPSHVHMHIQTIKAADFSLFMKKINLAYFHHYRQAYGWIGHFWQDRFRSQPIGKDSYFIQCGKYIELNPVRANIVSRAENYPYSSFRYYAKGEKNSLITEDIFYRDLGRNNQTRQKNYQKLVICEAVINTYSKEVWGSNYQQYHEGRKSRYFLRQKGAV